ncbi:MAG: hypothetical protein A3G34_02790 [Candidatus Lindowbacteria bacterium RIFCSPLOWO2_12_FULL_62_27]|nr:MAG: hypothetical protein A3G34_02790 [Candidatus Lindowbacteria bacterium RIFCSPLOWO2_12_FULL_62_27]OGH63352.1 MAG: hypothetical protein A3I06_08935 [Candidatus Lindowbacteria bacterium RIFCSPLOWO2_02_FULL_62_12]
MSVITKRQIEAIIFDLDGTLVNSISDLTAAVNHVLEKRGRPGVAQEVVRTFVGDGLAKLLGRALKTDDAEAVRAAAEDFNPWYDAHCLDSTVLYDGVRETLDRFSSKQLAVISNKPGAFTRKILEGLGVSGRFELVWGPESVRRMKPDPESFVKAAGFLGVPPDLVCAVGDRSTDVVAGRNAGMMTVGVTCGIGDRMELEAAGPDVLIGNLRELENYIE